MAINAIWLFNRYHMNSPHGLNDLITHTTYSPLTYMQTLVYLFRGGPRGNVFGGFDILKCISYQKNMETAANHKEELTCSNVKLYWRRTAMSEILGTRLKKWCVRGQSFIILLNLLNYKKREDLFWEHEAKSIALIFILLPAELFSNSRATNQVLRISSPGC